MTQSYNLSQLANNLNSSGQLDATDGLVNAVPAANGGTGQSAYTTGDILYASGTTALAKLSDVATGNALISGGVSLAPSWGKVGLTTHVSGTLGVANGGTGLTTIPLNNVVLGNGTSAVQTIAPGTSGNVLTSNGTSWASSASAALTGPRGVGFSIATTTAFTIPSGVTSLKVTAQGAGGGGGGNGGGSNGSSGTTSIGWLTGLTPGNTLSVRVGAGGAGAADVTSSGGGAGQTSYIATGITGTPQTITSIIGGGGGGGASSGWPGSGGGGTSSSGGLINGTSIGVTMFNRGMGGAGGNSGTAGTDGYVLIEY